MSPPKATLRDLLSLAWPIMVSRMSQTVIGLSDALLVAHLGAAALAAVATGSLNAMTVLMLPLGTSFIVQSFSAQLHAKGDDAGARRYGWYGLALAALTQVVCVAAWPFIDDALNALPYEPDVRELMGAFLRIRLLSGGAVIGIEALASHFGGLGRTRPGMVANITAMVLNVAGNWLLIDGHLGLPALGVRGSALASTIASAAAFLGFFVYFLASGPRVKLALREFVRMLRFGVPEGMNWFFEFGAFVFFANVIMASLGTTSLAAMNAVLNINSVSFMPGFGLASAGAILVGQAIGAQRKDDVPGVLWLTLRTAAAWQVMVGVICLLFPEVLISHFAEGEGGPEVAAAGARMLRVAALWGIFDASAMTLTEALRGAGDTLVPMLVRLALAWLLFAPGSYVTRYWFDWGDVATLSWVVVHLAALAGILFLRFRLGAWRRIDLVEPQA